MWKITIDIYDEYKAIVESSPNVVNNLLSDYIELEQDKITKSKLDDSFENKNLNMSLKTVLWI